MRVYHVTNFSLFVSPYHVTNGWHFIGFENFENVLW